MSEWKKIWNSREFDVENLAKLDDDELFLQLKKIDGFDITEDNESFTKGLFSQNEDIMNNLTMNGQLKINSVFDVGCGSGANLFLYAKNGLDIGGVDFSEGQVEVLKSVMKKYNLRECICDEANAIPTEEKYDAVYSNSVFSYFPDEDYALDVLKKMCDKANKSIGIVDIHDIQQKEAFKEYRRKLIEGYDTRYKDLPKFFYRREMFTDFAEQNGLKIVIKDSKVDGYWNNEFVFNVYMYK